MPTSYRHGGRDYRYSTHARERQAAAQAAAQPALDAAHLVSAAVDNGLDYTASAAAAHQLGHQRTAAAVPLLVEALVAAGLHAVKSGTEAAKPVGRTGKPATIDPVRIAQANQRIRRAYALGQEQARQRRLAKEAG